MQKINSFKLNNNGAFICAPKVSYINDSGDDETSDEGGRIASGQSVSISPGDHGVPDGSTIQLYIWIEAGNDRTGSPRFIYDASAMFFAEFDISGTTLNSTTGFGGVKPC